MKNNPLKPDDYIQQLYTPPKLIHIQKKKNYVKNKEIKSVTSNESSFPATLNKINKNNKICK